MTSQTFTLDLWEAPFPTRVTTPSLQTDRSRLVVYRSVAYLWIESDDGVQLALQAPVVSLSRVKQAGSPYVLTTESGDEWSCSRGSGCGCGSKLRRLNWKTEIQQLQTVEA